jgi:predicted O-methyltransferase YrrM
MRMDDEIGNTSEGLAFTERLLWIASECIVLTKALSPATITDRRITNLLQVMWSCRPGDDQKVNINLIPDFTQLDNHHVRWRSILEYVAKVAVWLTPGTRQAIAQLAALLPSILIRGKYEITFDCFSPRIPQWRRDLAHFVDASSIKCLEIGSFEGYSGCWLLDNILTHNSSCLVCIDKFDNEHTERLYDLNIQRSGASHRVVKLKGLSEDELVNLEKSSFDFIYVDGCHEQAAVLQDGVLAWRLLKPGGIMTFDDYRLADDPLFKLVYDEERPEIGIDAFLTVFDKRYRLVHSGYQVTVQKLDSGNG